jgi:hypothetical protein
MKVVGLASTYTAERLSAADGIVSKLATIRVRLNGNDRIGIMLAKDGL